MAGAQQCKKSGNTGLSTREAVNGPVIERPFEMDYPNGHPAGRPHDTAENRPDAHALNLHYARVGVDPAWPITATRRQ